MQYHMSMCVWREGGVGVHVPVCAFLNAKKISDHTSNTVNPLYSAPQWGLKITMD